MNDEQFGTTASYLKALQIVQAEGIPENHLALLRAHVSAHGHSTTWANLADIVGYPNGNSVNLQYGLFAERIARQLGLNKKPNDPGGTDWWLSVLVSPEEGRDPDNGHTVFVLRRPVVEAYRQLAASADSMSEPSPDEIDSAIPRLTGGVGREVTVVGKSVAHYSRHQLESLGEYVTRANVDWFAVFPEKLTELEIVAAVNGRTSNLIVYRTRDDDERDHHVIPLSELAGLFTDNTLTHSEVNGTVRWNVTLKNHVLKVSHSDLSLDVERYFRVPLLVEMGAPGDDPVRPIDLDAPGRVVATTYRILRDTVVARQLKADHSYCCQICGTTIELPDGTRYAEAHHVKPLGRPHDGPDVRDNMVVLCPNHHAMCDYGVMPLSGEMLRRIESHIVNPAFIAYHNDRVCRRSAQVVGPD